MSTGDGLLRAPSYFVLAALLDGPMHGYPIIKRVEELSDGSVKLATGSLYAVLDRLSHTGLIHLVSEEIVNGRTRRSYGLTDQGNEVLHTEAERLAAAAAVVTNHRTAGRKASGGRAARSSSPRLA